MSILTQRCCACGEEYGYIGESIPPGECPACGSPCVPPAGQLSIEDSRHWQSANGLSKLWVRADDARERPFEFEIAADETRGKLVGLKIDGIEVDPHPDDGLDQLPPEIRAEVEEIGVESVEAARQGI
jgi:hypothetical protein